MVRTIGTGTQDNSLINSSQNTAPTAQSGQTPSQGSGGGGGGGGGQLASMAQQIIQQLISSFTGAGDTGGLATYNQQQGALVKMEQAVKQLFSNMQNHQIIRELNKEIHRIVIHKEKGE